ncbi:CotH kinase family protein [Cohnella yongneupensis]|uniref:CotH kinase family protein n=1 Tax=Cohnella yongneupensis TaxID=425006 RepID=A0ABW0QXX4_9BACL
MTVPVMELRMSESAIAALERNLWSERYVDASLREGERSVQVKVRYRGGHTRNYPKRSYEISENGRHTHFNAEYDDPSMIRNALSFAFFNKIGVPSPTTRHVRLVVNGLPAGLYLAIEGVGQPFFRRRGLGAASLFYAVSNNSDFGLYVPGTGERKQSLLSGYEHRFGGASEKARLTAFIRAIHEPKAKRAIARLTARLDLVVAFEPTSASADRR